MRNLKQTKVSKLPKVTQKENRARIRTQTNLAPEPMILTILPIIAA